MATTSCADIGFGYRLNLFDTISSAKIGAALLHFPSKLPWPPKLDVESQPFFTKHVCVQQSEQAARVSSFFKYLECFEAPVRVMIAHHNNSKLVVDSPALTMSLSTESRSYCFLLVLCSSLFAICHAIFDLLHATHAAMSVCC